jgi:SulP family sulfate permease
MKIRYFLTDLTGRARNLAGVERVSLAPWTGALRHYSLPKLGADARAAANVTMLALPQAIAYATIAGLPIIFGILCAGVAAAVAPFFAGSRHTILGPTNATAFMLFSFFSMNPALAPRIAEMTVLLGVMVGLFAVAGSILRLADLLQFVSRSVLVGYISGAAVLIIAAQAGPMLGISGDLGERSAVSFISLVNGLTQSIGHTRWQPLLIGLSTIGIYALLRRLRPKWPAFALAMVTSSAIFGGLIRSGVPSFQGVETFASFGIAELTPSLPDFWHAGIFENLSSLLGVALAITFLASLENTLMAKTLASRTGEPADANQDMLAVGMANLASALAGGMPASGSLNRSMLNYDSGAATRFASLIGGFYTLAFAVAIALAADGGIRLIDYVPKATLAGMVIVVSLSLFNFRHINICLRSTGDDAAVLALTFGATILAPLHVAIFIGVAISIGLFLRKASHPFLAEYEFNEVGELRARGDACKRSIPAISIVHVEGDLFFGAAELFRTQIQRTVSDPQLKVIILRLKNARHLDATSVMALEDLIHFMREKQLHLLVSGATEEVHSVLKRSGILATLQAGCDLDVGESNLFLNSPANPNISTRDALRRAQQLLGTDKADIRIFFDPNKKH